jgi:hypothetical protein
MPANDRLASEFERTADLEAARRSEDDLIGVAGIRPDDVFPVEEISRAKNKADVMTTFPETNLFPVVLWPETLRLQLRGQPWLYVKFPHHVPI